ncbi:MAG: riboflavin biosynthesis protein RibF [Clostridia bacterium]|nr:riboflavin biosynthesis protein RibF [Clostridia bacterium]
MKLQILQAPVPVDRPTAVALGSFDGVHIGHMDVLRAAAACRAEGLRTAVFTLDGLIGTAKAGKRLISDARQEELFQSLGFDFLYRVDFASVRDMSPETFVREILHEKLRAQVVCCGFNYHFGRKGAGDSALLTRLCGTYGIRVVVVPPHSCDGDTVSSTRIRALLTQGDMAAVRRLLGRPYTIAFPVVHGRALGRTIGLPTINQPIPAEFVLPRFGVYASSTVIDGCRYHAVTNIGVKPTVGSDGPLAETWIIGFSGDLYGRTVPVELAVFLRPEQRFASVEELRQQILRDGDEAVKRLSTMQKNSEI